MEEIMEKIKEYDEGICKIKSSDIFIIRTAKRIIRWFQINLAIDKILKGFIDDRFIDYTAARNIAIVYHALKEHGAHYTIGLDNVPYRGYISKMFLGASSVTINITLIPINPKDTDITNIDFSYTFSVSGDEEVVSVTRGVYYNDRSSVHRNKSVGKQLPLDLKEGVIFSDIVVNHVLDKIHIHLVK